MKIVGGPHDGIDVWMGEGKQHIQLLDPMPLQSINDFDPHGKISPVGQLASFTIYTARMIRAARPPKPPTKNGGEPCDVLDPSFDELRFLAPHDWSDMKALRHQFTK